MSAWELQRLVVKLVQRWHHLQTPSRPKSVPNQKLWTTATLTVQALLISTEVNILEYRRNILDNSVLGLLKDDVVPEIGLIDSLSDV